MTVRRYLVTVTPGTGLPLASFTVTAKAWANAAFTTALCGVATGLAVIAAAVPGKFVAEKLAGVWPVTVAVTAYGPPAVLFVLNGAEATPEAFVVTVIVAVAFPNNNDAPLVGAAKTTPFLHRSACRLSPVCVLA